MTLPSKTLKLGGKDCPILHEQAGKNKTGLNRHLAIVDSEGTKLLVMRSSTTILSFELTPGSCNDLWFALRELAPDCLTIPAGPPEPIELDESVK